MSARSSRSQGAYRKRNRGPRSGQVRGVPHERQYAMGHESNNDKGDIVFDAQVREARNAHLDTGDEDKHDLNRALKQAAKSFVDRMRNDGVPRNLYGVDMETAQTVLAKFGSSIISQHGPSPFIPGDNCNEDYSVTHGRAMPGIERPAYPARERDRWRTHHNVQDVSPDTSLSPTHDTYDMNSRTWAAGSTAPRPYQAKNAYHTRNRQGIQRNARKQRPGTREKDLLHSTEADGRSMQPNSQNGTQIHDAELRTDGSEIPINPQLLSNKDEESKTQGSTDIAEELRALRLENETLKLMNSRLHADPASAQSPTKWRTLYRVHCPALRGRATFIDQPQLREDGDSRQDHRWHWEGWNRIAKSRLGAIEAACAPFVVYRDYDCSRAEKDEEDHSDDENARGRRGSVRSSSSSSSERSPSRRRPIYGKGHDDHEVKESVKIISGSLQRTVAQVFARLPGLQAYERYYDWNDCIMRAPYYFFYHFEAEIMEYIGQEETMTNVERTEFSQLLEYFTIQGSDARREARAAFHKGWVRSHLMPYLFKPGSLLLSYDGEQPICKKQVTTLELKPDNDKMYKTTSRGSEVWQVLVESVSYNGQFRSTEHMAFITLASGDARGQLISSLRFYPLEYVSVNDRQSLISRGNNFLHYCRKHYVTHSASSESQGQLSSFIKDDDLSDKHQTQVRYMIDAEAYLMLHEDDRTKVISKIIEPDLTSEDFLCQLPAFVKGYHMVDKKWRQLTVDHVCPVQWNKAAFENLEVADDTKELIKALITNKIDSNESVDFVEGKGTGLVVLLHGGPGTGKTLTAETVAEIAERPLYRVSCGDIGTEASHVESYLTSVFYLGRRWGSVVLLDEADVFLEERSLDNLQRNALVSVFLRMIEYYDGILVLTSNRVGIFDEAFKSRIQLSLYYPNLDLSKRRQIWINFVRRLETLQEKINKENIYKHIEDLAKYEMNGRQIRNAITSARQLSRYKKQPLDFEMLNNVINVGQRFEDYLREVKGHTADDYARHEGVR